MVKLGRFTLNLCHDDTFLDIRHEELREKKLFQVYENEGIVS